MMATRDMAATLCIRPGPVKTTRRDLPDDPFHNPTYGPVGEENADVPVRQTPNLGLPGALQFIDRLARRKQVEL